MIWVVIVCFLLSGVCLLNFRRHVKQGKPDLAGLNLLASVVLMVAAIVLVQFV